MNNTVAHQKFQGALMFALGSRPDIRVWPRKVGMAIPLHGDRPVYYGIKGESDLDGIVSGGRRLSIEIKTGSGRRSSDQINWGNMVTKFGGLYVLAHWDYDYEPLEKAVQRVVDEVIRKMRGGEQRAPCDPSDAGSALAPQ